MRRVAGLITGLAVGVVLFFCTGELLARVTNLVDRLNGYSRQLLAFGPGGDLPYVLRPGIETSMAGTAVRVNRFGLRGPDITPTPTAGVTRVLVVGDSVVFGMGLSEEETLPGALANALAANGSGSYEVLNAGVMGYDPPAEAEFLARTGLGLRPGRLVVQTSLNDYLVAPRLNALGVLTFRDLAHAPRLAERSEFLMLLRWLVGSLRGELFVQKSARTEHARDPGAPPVATPGDRAALDQVAKNLHLRFYHAPEPARWNRLRAAFARLRDLAAGQRVPLLVAIFPEGYQVGVPEPDLTPQRLLLDVCHEVGLRCLDLQPAFAAAAGRGDLFQDAQHPNAAGHAVAAAAIAAAIAE